MDQHQQQQFKSYVARAASFDDPRDNAMIAEMVEAARRHITEKWQEIKKELLTDRTNDKDEVINQAKVTVAYKLDATGEKRVVNTKITIARAPETDSSAAIINPDGEAV